MAGGVIIMIGPTGAGKTDQAKNLAQSRGMAHIAIGELLRRSRDPEILAQVADGRLVSLSKVEELLGPVLAAVPSTQDILLDGFPRTLSQVLWLERQFATLGRTLVRVFELSISLPSAQQRLRSRGRSDDVPEAIGIRWEVYQANIPAVSRYYEQRDLLTKVDAEGSREAVAAQLRAAL